MTNFQVTHIKQPVRSSLPWPDRMPRRDIHAAPFDEGTLAKLEIFETYTREWLPVFLSPEEPFCDEVHIFDFFAGEGTDSQGVFGSPLRILRQVKDYEELLMSRKVNVTVHFYDKSEAKIEKLEKAVDAAKLRVSGINWDIRPLPFDKGFQEALPLLRKRKVAKLVLADQYGVGEVDESTFRQLIESPVTDFLFFISSSVLFRFHGHPAMPLTIQKPEDYYRVHRAVLNEFKKLIPANLDYFLAPFSIKKGANIYGIVFGSAHLRGMDKFLNSAWKRDSVNGEANFDISKEDFREEAPFLPIDMFAKPTKVVAFENDLRQRILTGACRDELQAVKVCFEHGVTRQHASPVIEQLKEEALIETSFRVPDFKKKPPRGIRLLSIGQQ